MMAFENWSSGAVVPRLRNVADPSLSAAMPGDDLDITMMMAGSGGRMQANPSMKPNGNTENLA